jgi:maltodextrin utilization protein YvdJ
MGLVRIDDLSEPFMTMVNWLQPFCGFPGMITIIIGLVQRQLELQPIVAVKTHLVMISLLTGFLRHEEGEIHGSRAN